MSEKTKGLIRIRGVVQHYAWGGYDLIPSLLGIENKAHKPFAEYWLGVHPNHPARTEDGISLNELKGKNPRPAGEDSFDPSTIPYLLKVLDVRQMLSIQVHPDREGGNRGFEAENSKGIPLNAPERNYKDRNHKPELMVALGDFYLLHGFKPEEALRQTLKQEKAFHFLIPVFERGGYKALYETIMLMPQEEVNRVLEPLVQELAAGEAAGSLKKDEAGFWAARAIREYCSPGKTDRGIFSIYFFNLLHLKKGEGIFQPHGLPHAYLEGQNVEIMANSDNVLRAGLTEKHIDVPELLKHVRFEPVHPSIIAAGEGAHQVYPAPVEEFELHRYHADGGKLDIDAGAGEIWLLEEGMVNISGGGENMVLKRGESVLVTIKGRYRVEAQGLYRLFRVRIPAGEKS